MEGTGGAPVPGRLRAGKPAPAGARGEEQYGRALRLAKRLKSMLEAEKVKGRIHRQRLDHLLTSLRGKLLQQLSKSDAASPVNDPGADGLSLDDVGFVFNEDMIRAVLPSSSDAAAPFGSAAQFAQALLSDVVARAAQRDGFGEHTGAEVATSKIGPQPGFTRLLRPVCVLHMASDASESVLQLPDKPSVVPRQAWVLVEVSDAQSTSVDAPETSIYATNGPGHSSASAGGATTHPFTQVWVHGSTLQLMGEDDDDEDEEEGMGAAAEDVAEGEGQTARSRLGAKGMRPGADADADADAPPPVVQNSLLLGVDWTEVPVLWMDRDARRGRRDRDGSGLEKRKKEDSGGVEAEAAIRHSEIHAQATGLAKEATHLREALLEAQSAQGRMRIEHEVAMRRVGAELADARRRLAEAEDDAALLRDRAGEAAARARTAEAREVHAQAASIALEGVLGTGGSNRNGSRVELRTASEDVFDDRGKGALTGAGAGAGAGSASADSRELEIGKLRRDFAAYRRRAMELLKEKERISDDAEESVAVMRKELRAGRERVKAAEAEAARLRRMRGAASAVPVGAVPLRLPVPETPPSHGGRSGSSGGDSGPPGHSAAARAMLSAAEAAASRATTGGGGGGGEGGNLARAGDSSHQGESTGAGVGVGVGAGEKEGRDAERGGNDARVAYLRNLVLQYMVQRRRAAEAQSDLGRALGSSGLTGGGTGSGGSGAGSGMGAVGGGGGAVLHQMEAAIADILGFSRAEKLRLDDAGKGGSGGAGIGSPARGFRSHGTPSSGQRRKLGLLAKRDLERERAGERDESTGGGGLDGEGSGGGGLLGGLWNALVGDGTEGEDAPASEGNAGNDVGEDAGGLRPSVASVLGAAPGGGTTSVDW